MPTLPSMNAPNPKLDLFRKEVVDHQRETELGEILLARPVSNTRMMWIFACIALATIGFTWKGEYTKKARATGYVVPDQGLLKVYPQAPGFVTELKVHEGDVVSEGQVLAVVTMERAGSQGNTQAEIAKQIAFRRQSLADQRDKTHRMYVDLLDSTQKRLTQTLAEQRELRSGIASLKQRVANAEKVVARYNALQKENFVAELAVTEKESDLLDQRNRLTDLSSRLSSNQRDLTSLQSDMQTLPIKERNDLASIDRAMSELDSTHMENEARREFYVVAPQSGTVTQLLADKGRAATPSQPLMNLIPVGSRLLVNLYVPSRARGFIKPGSIAQMQYEAYPYQKFGTHPGKVTNISRTSVPLTELPFPIPSAPANEVYYVVTVQPEKDYVLAYGVKEPLQAGMQLDADVWLDRRTVFEWVLEPLYSISGRV